MADPRFGLTDDQFFTAPYATADALKDRLSDTGFLGLVIDAPQRVLFEHRDRLPVVGCHRATDREARQASFDDLAALSAVRLEDGLVLAALVEPPRVMDTSDPPAPDPKPDPDAPTVTYATMFLADARARLDLPWDRGTWLLTAHLAGRDSNRVRVELDRPRYGFPDEAVAAARAEAARETWPAPVAPKPGTPLPRYTRAPDSPHPPEGLGVKLVVPRRAAALRGLVVQGAFRLPVRPGDLVRPRPDDPAFGVGAPGATAVVPITLVVRGDRTPGPFVVRLRVPTFDPPSGAPPVVTGQFALDLLAAEALRHRTPQRYVVHAFAGEALAGPYEVDLVAGAKV